MTMEAEAGDRVRITLGRGLFVCVVGPSGAGKDTLIDHARRRLAGEGERFVFPRRLVTRAASTAEDHDVLTEEAYGAGVAGGAFSLYWRAHGLGYALPRSVETALANGSVVVCNISRAQVAGAREAFARIAVVLVTAPDAVIARRLAARGRESAETIAARLARGKAVVPDRAPDLTIVNDGSVEAAGEKLVAFLRGALGD